MSERKKQDDEAEAQAFYAQLKLWYALLTKGFGLVPSMLGGLSVAGPLLVPLVPKVLSGYMILWAVLFFMASTFLATSLRISSKRPRPMVAGVFFVTSVGAFLAFLWLLDAAPRWPLIHEQPQLVRGIAALPYGLMIGALCAGLAALIPVVPTDTNRRKKNTAL